MPKAMFDMHMMVAQPEKWVSHMHDAGADQGSVQQSRLSSQFAFQPRNFSQLFNTQKNVPFCISIFNLEVYKMGFKSGMAVLLI